MGERIERLGDYRITGVLGEGGGGVVYAASGPEGEVALKVPPADRELTERDRERYLAEAAMMDRARHPAIVEVLAAGVLPDGRPFVAMPRLAGRTLAQKVFDDGPFEVDAALDLFDQLADATMALHAADLLHRDLKAENVFLLDGDTKAKLLDFGIAKDRSAPVRHTTTGLVRGTPATMAPERFFGAAASEQSDVYELAVVLYVMLVGRLPWAGDETDVKARAHPMPAHALQPRVPVALSQVLMQAFATRPEHRPATPRALAAALREACARPSSPAANATVTSQHLRELIAHETPFDAAVASRPEPMASVPSRRRFVPVALGASLLLAAAAIASASEEPRVLRSDLATAGVRAAAALAWADADERDDARAAEAAPGGQLASHARERSDPPKPSTPKLARPATPRPAAKPAPAVAPAGSGLPAGPPGGEIVAPPIPGGVYDTPPYE